MRGYDAAETRQSTANLLIALKREHPDICGAPPPRWWRTRKRVGANGCIDHLIERAAKLTGVQPDQLLGTIRRARLTRVRFAIVHAATREGYGPSAIAREMKRDPSSISSAKQRAMELLATDADFADLCRRIGVRA